MTRVMGDYDVYQRTIDGYFDGASLIRQWNSTIGNKQKRISDFLENSGTKEFINALMDDEKSLWEKSPKGHYQLVIKSKGKMSKNGRSCDKVWMHPLLFLKFAMWLNPRFEVKVLRFVQDQLIDFRDKAGNSYKRMCSALSLIISGDRFRKKVSDLAKSLNIIVYGIHHKMIRNHIGEEEKARELFELEDDISKMIELGYIKNENELRIYLYKVLERKRVLPI